MEKYGSSAYCTSENYCKYNHDGSVKEGWEWSDGGNSYCAVETDGCCYNPDAGSGTGGGTGACEFAGGVVPGSFTAQGCLDPVEATYNADTGKMKLNWGCSYKWADRDGWQGLAVYENGAKLVTAPNYTTSVEFATDGSAGHRYTLMPNSVNPNTAGGCTRLVNYVPQPTATPTPTPVVGTMVPVVACNANDLSVPTATLAGHIDRQALPEQYRTGELKVVFAYDDMTNGEWWNQPVGLTVSEAEVNNDGDYSLLVKYNRMRTKYVNASAVSGFKDLATHDVRVSLMHKSADGSWVKIASLAPSTVKLCKQVGESNGDGKVDNTDFNRWYQAYRAGRYNAEVDFNGDGRVDLADYQVWWESYTE